MKSIVFAGRWVVGSVLLSVLASGCPKPVTGRPVWMYSRDHMDYPDNRYLVGVGRAATRELAEENARSDLRGRLKIKLAQAWQPLGENKPKGWFDPYKFTPKIPGKLPQPKIAKSWSGPQGKLHAALAVWELSAIAGSLKESADAAGKACQAACLQADQARSKGDPYLELKSRLEALKARADLDAYLAFQRAILADPKEAPELPPVKELSRRVCRLLSAVSLQVVAGDGQRIGSAGELRNPLVVAVRLTDKPAPVPLAGMPVRFWPEGRESRGARTRSSELGLASSEQAPDPGTDLKNILAGPDPAAVLADAGIDPTDRRFAGFAGLARKARANFKLLAAGDERLRVLVMLSESVSDESSGDSVLVAELAKGLARAGFEVLTADDLPEAFAALEDPQQLLQAARGHARVMIAGKIEARVSEVVTQNFVFSQVSGKIEVIDLKSGAVLASFEQPVKGAGLDVYSASARALSSLSRQVLPGILKTIKQMEFP